MIIFNKGSRLQNRISVKSKMFDYDFYQNRLKIKRQDS